MGIQEQIQRDRSGQHLVANMQVECDTSSESMMEEANKMKERYKTIEEDDGSEYLEAWRDVSGSPLSPKEVQKTRQEEIDYVHKNEFIHQATNREIQNCDHNAPNLEIRAVDTLYWAMNTNYDTILDEQTVDSGDQC